MWGWFQHTSLTPAATHLLGRVPVHWLIWMVQRHDRLFGYHPIGHSRFSSSDWSKALVSSKHQHTTWIMRKEVTELWMKENCAPFVQHHCMGHNVILACLKTTSYYKSAHNLVIRQQCWIIPPWPTKHCLSFNWNWTDIALQYSIWFSKITSLSLTVKIE